MGLPTTMWSAPERNASVGVTTRRWSSLRCAVGRSDAGRHDQRSGPQGRAQRRRLEPGSDDAVAPCGRRLQRALEHELLDAEIDAHRSQIRGCDARQHRDHEDLELLAFRERGRFHDRAVAVHGQERRAGAAQLPHGRRHRRGDVVELEIGEDLFVALDEPVEQLEVVARGRELEPDLVERDAIAEARDELLRAFEVRNVEREDQSVPIGDAARGFCDCGGHGRILAAASGRRAGHRASATRSGRSCRRCSRRRRGQRRPRRPPRPYPKRAPRARPASGRSGPSAR